MFIFSKDEQRGYILTLQTYHQSENKYKQTQHESRETGTIRKSEVVVCMIQKNLHPFNNDSKIVAHLKKNKT